MMGRLRGSLPGYYRYSDRGLIAPRLDAAHAGRGAPTRPVERPDDDADELEDLETLPDSTRPWLEPGESDPVASGRLVPVGIGAEVSVYNKSYLETLSRASAMA
jgi:hypothetical protein